MQKGENDDEEKQKDGRETQISNDEISNSEQLRECARAPYTLLFTRHLEMKRDYIDSWIY